MSSPLSAPEGHRRRPITVIMIILVIATIIGAWWIDRPRRVADHFIRLVSKGEFDAAKEMLRDPASMVIDTAGNVTLAASDGTVATLTKNELPLFALDDFYSRPPRREGIGDYLVGRYQFEMASTGSDIQSERQEPIEVYADAVGGAIVIVSIKEH